MMTILLCSISLVAVITMSTVWIVSSSRIIGTADSEDSRQSEEGDSAAGAAEEESDRQHGGTEQGVEPEGVCCSTRS